MGVRHPRRRKTYRPRSPPPAPRSVHPEPVEGREQRNRQKVEARPHPPGLPAAASRGAKGHTNVTPKRIRATPRPAWAPRHAHPEPVERARDPCRRCRIEVDTIDTASTSRPAPEGPELRGFARPFAPDFCLGKEKRPGLASAVHPPAKRGDAVRKCQEVRQRHGASIADRARVGKRFWRRKRGPSPSRSRDLWGLPDNRCCPLSAAPSCRKAEGTKHSEGVATADAQRVADVGDLSVLTRLLYGRYLGCHDAPFRRCR